jgi:hypothetical protein
MISMPLQSMSVLENVDETGFLLTKIEGSTPHTLPGHMCSRSVAEVPLTYAACAVLCSTVLCSLTAGQRSARSGASWQPRCGAPGNSPGCCRSCGGASGGWGRISLSVGVSTAQVASSCGARVTEIAEQRTTPYCIYRQN